jgi:hypothetical protein
MSDSVEYTVRRHAFEKQRTWRIDAAGVSWSAEDKSGRFDFSEISTIRLQWAASRADHARYACQVARANGWTETIVSTHYDGPMQFPDRRGTYLPFVHELVRRTAAANPACHFRAGTTPVRFLGNLTAMIAGLALLALVALTLGVPFTGIVVMKLIVIAALLPLALAWFKKNRPRPFDPANIPADILPSPH